ncbi:hypothetical protein BT96DRAFT_930017, partial [Gymnopus androsaceus JB14]
MAQFARLLRNPKTVALRRLVQTVYLDWINYDNREEMDDISFIFQSLPSVTELLYEPDGGPPCIQHFQAIGMHMGETLEALWIDFWDLEKSEDCQSFKDMLASLTVLKLLALPSCWFKDEPLVLPSSLRTLYVGGNFFAVEQGLGISYPPMLSTVFLDYQPEFDASGNRLLRVLRPDTRVVLNVGNGGDGKIFPPVLMAFIQGLKVSQLILDVSRGPFIISLIVHIASYLPESVREISIDFDAGVFCNTAEFDLVSKREDWAQLDRALKKRYEPLGSLKSFGVRCTSRTNRYGWLFYGGSPIDRTILDDVRTLLPLSDAAGILKVDHAAFYFDDYYFWCFSVGSVL